MPEYSFPFDAVFEDTTAKWDREYNAIDFIRYFANFIGNGIFPNPSNNLQITSNSTMTVTLMPGAAFAKGVAYNLDEPVPFLINTSHPSYNRKDVIVIRLDLTDRVMLPLCIAGTAGASPVEPALVRTEDIFDLRLAVVTVRAGTGSVLQSDILDTRLDNNVCGIVHGLIDQVSTTAIFNQYQTYLNAQIALWNTIRNTQETQWQNQTDQIQSDWNTWFAMIHVDLQTYATFNFDHLAALPGVDVNITGIGTPTPKEIMTLTSGGAEVARREWVQSGSNWTATEVVQMGGGSTRTRTITYNKQSSSAWKITVI